VQNSGFKANEEAVGNFCGLGIGIGIGIVVGLGWVGSGIAHDRHGFDHE
jgi:hypothetical protein